MHGKPIVTVLTFALDPVDSIVPWSTPSMRTWALWRLPWYEIRASMRYHQPYLIAKPDWSAWAVRGRAMIHRWTRIDPSWANGRMRWLGRACSAR